MLYIAMQTALGTAGVESVRVLWGTINSHLDDKRLRSPNGGPALERRLGAVFPPWNLAADMWLYFARRVPKQITNAFGPSSGGGQILVSSEGASTRGIAGSRLVGGGANTLVVFTDYKLSTAWPTDAEELVGEIAAADVAPGNGSGGSGPAGDAEGFSLVERPPPEGCEHGGCGVAASPGGV